MIDREALALQLPLRKELRAELREQRLRDYLQFLKEHVPLYKNSQAYDANYDLPGGEVP